MNHKDISLSLPQHNILDKRQFYHQLFASSSGLRPAESSPTAITQADSNSVKMINNNSSPQLPAHNQPATNPPMNATPISSSLSSLPPANLDIESAVLFQGVTIALDGVKILDSVTAQVPRGSCTAIIGPNGAGKTTLLLALLGQIAYQGNIQIFSQPNCKRPVIRYVPQKLEFDRGMPMTVADLLALDLQKLPLWFGIRSKIKQKIRESLAQVKAESLYSRRLGTLSGGELQRVLLALALVESPDILVLDEPAANIDIQGELLVCEILEKLRRSLGFTQIMVSHDLPMVISHATHVICLNRRVMGEGCPQKTLRGGILAATFGIHADLENFYAFQQDAQYPCDMRCAKEGHHHPNNKSLASGQ